jgi:hypothetical protein
MDSRCEAGPGIEPIFQIGKAPREEENSAREGVDGSERKNPLASGASLPLPVVDQVVNLPERVKSKLGIGYRESSVPHQVQDIFGSEEIDMPDVIAFPLAKRNSIGILEEPVY